VKLREVAVRLADADLGPEIPTTRITPPHVSRRWLPRPRLNARLGVPPDKRLILVTSAAGFGKSSCLAAWCRQLALADVPVAWLSAERPDSDVHTFFADLAAALQRTGLGIGDDVVELVGRRGRTISPGLLENLILKAIAAQSAPVVLVIDDYHMIASPAIDDALSGLLAHAPENLRLVIAGRSAPSIRLGKLRAADEVLELSPADLAFDFEEVRSFLRDRCEMEVPASDIATLLEATEGWAASLQTIAIAMRAPKDLQRVMRSMIGQPQMLRRYLREEVMQELPTALRDFLLRTSILDAFNAELAGAVAGVSDAANVLAEIERRQLFLVSLDDDGQWFRYHHLFGECLRKELVQTCPDEVMDLHLRAADWLAGAWRWGDAVRHALEAHAPERALRIVESCAMELVQRGDYLTLTGLLKRLPEASWRESVTLELAYAWALAYGGVRVETEEVLARAAARLSSLPAGEAGAVEIESKLVALTIAAFADRTDHITRILAENESLYAARDTWARDVVNVSESFAYAYANRYERSRECLPCVHPFKRVFQLIVYGIGWWRQGRLQNAAQEWHRALDLALTEFGARSISAVVSQCMLAQVHYERGNFELLDLALSNRLEFIEETAPTDGLISALTALAWSRAARGEFADAEALLNRLRVLGKTRGWLRAEAVATVELLRLGADHAIGDAGYVAHRAEEVLAQEPMPSEMSTMREALQCFRLAAAFNAALNGFSESHLDRLQAVVDEFDVHHGVPLTIRANVMLARACVQHGATDRGHAAMTAAVTRAQNAGMMQTIRDVGPWALALMPHLAGAAVAPGAVSAGKATSPSKPEAAVAGAPAPVATARAGATLPEAISVREKEVLQLVDRGLSNKEIARVLRLEPATVKWHLKNIFAKLGVANRVQAINCARGAALIG
jgi:LuxR family transcriptional regulator, maltose regulon positive regulatory protein